MKILKFDGENVTFVANTQELEHLFRATYHTEDWVGTELLEDIVVAAEQLELDLEIPALVDAD